MIHILTIRHQVMFVCIRYNKLVTGPASSLGTSHGSPEFMKIAYISKCCWSVWFRRKCMPVVGDEHSVRLVVEISIETGIVIIFTLITENFVSFKMMLALLTARRSKVKSPDWWWESFSGSLLFTCNPCVGIGFLQERRFPPTVWKRTL